MAAPATGTSNRVTDTEFLFLTKTEWGNWHICLLTSVAIKGTSKLIPRDSKTQKRMRKLK